MSRLTIGLVVCVVALLAVVTGQAARDSAFASISAASIALLAHFVFNDE